ncbi:sensor histidine kinase [Flavobacterium kingsejongi]|uniref:Histidine kinase domain-containing protein n=1 Tax=Flavobacterium kingsejongi TaxID=1678728 RepID=A0A2S1LL81_9FLAO|nr:tetratricopeptide repeat-containing sensor histidine kinase [Flavobacterium kingsejongi]AWG24286.1 hypothetical protein FK004_03125 [Flavobacterium kingsejongi]
MKNPFILFTVFLLLFSCNQKGEKLGNVTKAKDSLSIYLAVAYDETKEVEVRRDNNYKALDIIVGQSNDSMNRKYLFDVANRFYNMNDLEGYKAIVQKIENNSRSAKDTASVAKSLSYIGDYYAYKSVSDSAYLNYSKAAELYSLIHDDFNIGRMYLNKAMVQTNESDLLGSESSVFKALKHFRNNEDDKMIYEANNILGVVYNELKEYPKSIEYHQKAISIAEKGKIDVTYQAKATSLNNLGFVYKNMGDHYEAVEKFREGLSQKNLFRDKTFIYAMLLDNLAYSKFKLNDTHGLPGLFYKSLRIRDSLKIIPGIIINEIHLSEYYAHQKDTLMAMDFAKSAYKTAKDNRIYRDVLLTLKQLTVINKAKSADYSAEYIAINDSLQQAERNVRNKLARIEFETDELIIQKDELVERNRTIIYTSVIIIFIGLLLFVIRTQNSKNKELLMRQDQQKANENIYNLMLSQQKKIEEVRHAEKTRIAQELHDSILGRLFGTRLNLDSLNKKTDEDSVQDRYNYIAQLQHIEQDIREISHDLSNEKNAMTNNFVAIVKDLINEQEKLIDAEINFNLDASIEWELIDNDIKINLYRILQEAFQNINKYANAKHVGISILKIRDVLKFIIEDDGVGFDATKKSKGIGLRNMESRVMSFNGTLNIIAKKGEGTQLEILVPNPPKH